MTYQSFNPATGKLLKTFEDLTDAQLEAKLTKAEACFGKWKLTSYADRALVIAKAAKLLHERVEELAKTMTLEMGKRIGEARGEVEFSSKIMAYYAKNAESFLADTKLSPSTVMDIWRAARLAWFSASSLGISHIISWHASRARI